MSRDPPLSRHWPGTQFRGRDVRRYPPQWAALPRPHCSRHGLFLALPNRCGPPRARNRAPHPKRGGPGNSCTMPPCEPASPPAWAALSGFSPRFSRCLPALGPGLLPPWARSLGLLRVPRVSPAGRLHKVPRRQQRQGLPLQSSLPERIFPPQKNSRLPRTLTGVSMRRAPFGSRPSDRAAVGSPSVSEVGRTSRSESMAGTLALRPSSDSPAPFHGKSTPSWTGPQTVVSCSRSKPARSGFSISSSVSNEISHNILPTFARTRALASAAPASQKTARSSRSSQRLGTSRS